MWFTPNLILLVILLNAGILLLEAQVDPYVPPGPLCQAHQLRLGHGAFVHGLRFRGAGRPMFAEKFPSWSVPQLQLLEVTEHVIAAASRGNGTRYSCSFSR